MPIARALSALRRPGGIINVSPSISAQPSYYTAFSGTENPISEGGAWDHTASNFQLVRTTGGYATGAAYTEVNDDCYARLTTSAFQAANDDYEVTATVRIVSGGVATSEIELLLRMITDASTMQAYEVLINTSGGGELVRINGSPGNYFEIPGTSFTISGWTGNGDRIRARVTGTNPVVITVYHAPAATPTVWTQIVTYNDTDATRKQTGQPGIGFYQHAASNNLLNAGWDDFAATATLAEFDFTTASIQDPISLNGTWTNNTQGTMSNATMGTLTSMRIAQNRQGTGTICCGNASGQSSPPQPTEYMDCFGLAPMYLPGNQIITAEMYCDPGYTPVANHESELIVGCVILSPSHFTWIENNTGVNGGAQMASFLNVDAGGYNILSPTDTGVNDGRWVTGDLWRAVLDRTNNQIRTYVKPAGGWSSTTGQWNAALRTSFTDATLVAQLGPYVGLAGFRRTIEGFSDSTGIGFRKIRVESF